MQNGETEPYAYIVRAYQQPLYRYCLRMLGSRPEAEDAVQDILVRAFEKIGGYRPSAPFSAWLYKIAYRHCLNALRKRRVRAAARWLAPSTVAGSAEDEVVASMFAEPLDRAWRRLTAEERHLLALRVWEERPFDDIASTLGIGTAAAKKRFERLLRKLTGWIAERADEKKEEGMPCGVGEMP